MFLMRDKIVRREEIVKIVAYQKIPLEESSPIECVSTPAVVQKQQRRPIS